MESELCTTPGCTGCINVSVPVVVNVQYSEASSPHAAMQLAHQRVAEWLAESGFEASID
jgi:hypothetical protein